MRDFVRLPVTQAEVERGFQGFMAAGAGVRGQSGSGLPQVFGVVDCTHVRLASAGGEKPQNYTNSAGWFSMNVQVTATTLK